MGFDEKLDFLMNITKTTNSALALYTSLDASHISRLRSGKRKLSKGENFVKSMAVYFSKHCGEEYQKKALGEVLKKPFSFFYENNETVELLHSWLLKENAEEEAIVAEFMDSLSHFQSKRRKEIDKEIFTTMQKSNSDLSVYFGTYGKRQAVIALLSGVLNTQEPQKLLLFSDEDMDWLTGDCAFMSKWESLMTQVVMKGNKIRIIHTISRHLDDMLAAIAKWLPLYMTGSIEPYYYPKKRDGIFKRTLFIAPRTAAVVSSSVGQMEDKAAVFLLKEKNAIDAICKEFENYYILCRPLLRIYTSSDRLEFMKTLLEFEIEEATSIIKTGNLSLSTMPSAVIKSIIARLKTEQKNDLANYINKRKEVFVKNIAEHGFFEIIRIPDISFIKEAKVKISLCDLFEIGDLYYTVDEFRLHLENMVELLKTYDYYNIYIESDIEDDGTILYSKEDVGAIIIKTTIPSAVFAINESNMTAAFWDYLKNKIDERSMNKENTIKELQKLIEILK